MSHKYSKREESKEVNNVALDESEPTLPEGFQVNILDLVNLYISFIDKILDQGVESPCKKSFLEIAHTYVKSRDPDELITNFIEKSNKDWELCSTKDEKTLFANIKALFPGIPDGSLSSVAAIFTTRDKKGKLIVTEMDKKIVWEYVTEFIRSGILYIHKQRAWGMKPNSKMGYTKVYFSDISVKTYAEMFDVGLSK